MIKVLVLGGTRYLGKAIVNKISGGNFFEIATLSRSEEKRKGRHFVCDRKGVDDLKKVLVHFDPNIILDMINFDEEDSQGISELYENGFISELNHYIMVSSFFVYNHFDYDFFSEKKLTEKFNLSNIEGYTKRKIQSEVKLYSSSLMDISTILRLPFVFSSDDYTQRFQYLCELSSTENESFSEPSFKYSLLRKDDAVEAIIKLFKSSPMGITDLSNVGHITSKEILDTLNRVANQSKRSVNSDIGSFPYFVEKDICLNSKKMTINMPIHDALKIEAENYWRSK